MEIIPTTVFPDTLTQGCSHCLDRPDLDFDFTYAFQPIIDTQNQRVYAYEALVRGLNGEGAAEILSKVDDTNRYQFDQLCRIKAVSLAAQLGVTCKLNINFLPNAIYRPELCIRTTIEAAEHVGFPLENIVFEVTEGEKIEDQQHLKSIINHYKSRGIGTAIDDFGAGYAGLNLLANYQPDIIKLDMELIQQCDRDNAKRAIIKGITQVARELNIEIIAEGVETPAEYTICAQSGIHLFQGYLFARPGFETLPEADLSILNN